MVDDPLAVRHTLAAQRVAWSRGPGLQGDAAAMATGPPRPISRSGTWPLAPLRRIGTRRTSLPPRLRDAQLWAATGTARYCP
jgi:hypothetical protein